MFALIAAKNINKTNLMEHLIESKGQQFVASKLLAKRDSELIEKYKQKLKEVIEYKNMSYTEYLVDLDINLENLSA